MNERIRLLRKELGLNQSDFGNKIGVKPVSYTHLTLPTIA